MRQGTGQVGRVLLGVASLAGLAALGGCGMTPRDTFFSDRSITFRSSPGEAGPRSTGLASGRGSADLAAAMRTTR
jgi:hypothetical protein